MNPILFPIGSPPSNYIKAGLTVYKDRLLVKWKGVGCHLRIKSALFLVDFHFKRALLIRQVLAVMADWLQYQNQIMTLNTSPSPASGRGLG